MTIDNNATNDENNSNDEDISAEELNKIKRELLEEQQELNREKDKAAANTSASGVVVESESKTASEYTELTYDQFEQELIQRYHFKATKDTEELYFYDKTLGIFLKNAEWLIKRESLKFNPKPVMQTD